MKRIIVLFVLLLNINSTNAHKEWVHKHIIIQAFEFLKIYYPNITNTDFNLFLGSNYSAGCDGVAYNYGTLTAGAWREDCEDPVFLRHGLFNQRTSITHFWHADQGDNSMIQLCDPECWSYTNAYQKALIYKNGGWELNIQISISGFPTNSNGSGGCATQWVVVTFRYDGLRDIYVNNNLYVTKVKWNTGETTIYNNPIKFTSSHWSSLNSGSYILFLKKIAFETIGRISHLLQDMSVPAHANNDHHPCDIWNPDAYELFIAGNDWSPTVCNKTKTTFPAQNYTAITALAQGGFIHLNGMNLNEIIRFLFYTQNQLSDHFPSGRPNTSGYTNKYILGDNDLPNGSNPYLMERYSILGSPPNSFDYHQIASETLNFSIRANAALLYWFAIELEIIPNTLINNSFNGGNIRVDGSNYSSGHRLPSWNNPSSINLQAIDQVYNNCYWRFQNWQKIQNGIVVQTLNTRNITIIPTANTTYKANFTSENSFNFVKTGPLKGLYHGESISFTINSQYGNPFANYYWHTKYRTIINGYENWTSGLPEACLIDFWSNGKTATFSNIYFSTYCGGWWADSVIRVYGTVQPANCGSPVQHFFEEITLKNRERPGYPPPPPPSGGCPYIYTWNGSNWVEDNNILPQSQSPDNRGQNVTDYYQLYTKPAEENGKYFLAISEHEEDISYFDQVKLLVIDHPYETFVTVDDNGDVVQFAKPSFFADALLDSADVYKLLYSLDSIKTEVNPNDTLSLTFQDVPVGDEQWLLLVGQVQAAVAKSKVSGRIKTDYDDGKENSYSFTSFRLRRNPTY